MPFKNILFATDFSKTSSSALDLARLLKKTDNAQLHIVHVFNPSVFEVPVPYHFPASGAVWTQENMTQLRDNGKQALVELSNEISDAQTHYLEGRPGPTLCDFSEKQQIDLIILGSHGYGSIDRLFLGSVALYVSCHAKCTVMTVKPAFE